MKTMRKSVLAGLMILSLGATGAALAQGPGKADCGPAAGAMGMPGSGGMHRGANVDARLAQIKSELKITADQEGAWQVFETAVKTHRVKPRDAMAAKTAPERADARVAYLEQRLAGAREVAQAIKDLYGKLSPEQRTTADQVLTQRRR